MFFSASAVSSSGRGVPGDKNIPSDQEEKGEVKGRGQRQRERRRRMRRRRRRKEKEKE